MHASFNRGSTGAGAFTGIMALLLAVSAIGQALPGGSPPLVLGTNAPASSEEPMFDAKFNSTPLEMVMQEYGDLTGKAAIIAPGLSANISLSSHARLTRQEYIDAIESILAMNNVAIVPYTDKFVKVVKFDTARAHGMKTTIESPGSRLENIDRLTSRIIELKYMEIAEAQPIIDAFRSPFGKTHALERINSILITDSATHINRILEVLARLDQPVKAKEELFVVPILNATPSEIKAKLEEIIDGLNEKKKPTAKPTVAAPRTSGPPGVIRAPHRPTSSSSSAPVVDVEKGIIRGQVKIVADDRTGKLIFITQVENMDFLNDIVKALDIKTSPDVVIKIYRLEFANAEEVASMLNSLIGATTKDTVAPTPAAADSGSDNKAPKVRTLQDYVKQRSTAAETERAGKSKVGELSAENIKILPDKRTNALIVMASRGDIDALNEIINDMDMMLSQVLIEAVIVEVDLSDGMQTGVDWMQRSMVAFKKDSGDPVFAFTGKGGGGSLTPEDATGTPAYPAGGGLSYYFTHFGLNLDVVMRAASEDDRTRVVQAPVILTTDNTEAEIASTKDIYVYDGQKQDQYGQTYDDYSTKPVGLTLKVTPKINTNKVVMMKISQEMSEPGSIGEPTSGATVLSKRTLNAEIAVRDGETIVLGGQVRNKENKNRKKIPLLGDIPLLGRAFNSTVDSSSKTEMIVFITPYVLNSPEEIAAESKRRRNAIDVGDTWKKGWSNSDLAEPTRKQLKEQKKEEKRQEVLAKDIEKQRKVLEMERIALERQLQAKAVAEQELQSMLSENKKIRQEKELESLRDAYDKESERWSKSLKILDGAVQE